MKKRSYSQWVLILFLAALLLFVPLETKAEGSDSASPASEPDSTSQDTSIDWSKYSYDDLLLIRDNLNEYIREAERQYAIENGNRVITLNEKEVTLYNKKTFALQADVKRVVEDAPEKTTLSWKSSDESVAKVSNTGVVTGVGYGDATITCVASDDEYIFAESVFHVVLPATGLTLDSANVTLLLSEQKPSDGTATLSCTVKPDNAHIKGVTWTSSDEKVVSVDKKGNLRAVAPGTATITARSKDPEASNLNATCRVTVLQAVSKITLSKTSLSLNINASATLTATVLPANASNKKVAWKSSDTKVATVSNNGMVKAVGPGTAKITCTAEDGSKVLSECDVKCIQMVTSVKFDVKEKTVTLSKGSTKALKTAILPANATDKSLTWSSSNPKIVSVSKKGAITAESGGAATITCTANDGSGKTASIEVYVPSISVRQTDYWVTSKDGLTIDIQYYGRAKDFSYTMTPTNLCTVNEKKNGDTISLTITPDRAGTATITLKDGADRRSDTKITVTIEHSACYDSSSYPLGKYSDVLRSPSSFRGTNMSIKGRVLQMQSSWFSTVMRVATRGRYDDVFYIDCPSYLASGIIEGDYITIYGTCTGTYTYTSVLGASITVPSIDAEKVILGK